MRMIFIDANFIQSFLVITCYKRIIPCTRVVLGFAVSSKFVLTAASGSSGKLQKAMYKLRLISTVIINSRNL